jgi:hypothetical protein
MTVEWKDALVELRAEVTQLKDTVRTLERRSRSRGVALMMGVALSTWVASALAGTEYPCSSGALPLSLFCFDRDTPALANQVNGNFKTLGDAVVALQNTTASTSLAVTSLTNQVAGLQLTVNGDGGVIAGTNITTGATTIAPRRTGLVGAARTVSGTTAGGIGGCGQSVGAPCVIPFPPAYFTAPPQCAVAARVPDTTPYSEHPVITTTTASSVSFWEGNTQPSGINLFFDWVCVGN